MIHHYLQRGHKLNDLVNLSFTEKEYMKASMNLYAEEEAAKWGTE